MEAIRETQKRYCSRALTFAIIAGFIFFLAGMTPICKGLVMGTLFSILNFILMGEGLPMRVDGSKKKMFFVVIGSIFFRFILLAVPMVLAIKQPQYNFFATIAGIFLVQLTILTDHLFALIVSRFQKQVKDTR